MNITAFDLLGLAGRGLLLGGFGTLVVLILKRRSPAVGASAALAALSALVVGSILSFTPWPAWQTPLKIWASKPQEASTGLNETPSPASTVPDNNPPPQIADSRPDYWALLREELERAQSQPGTDLSQTQWSWAAWLGAMALAFSALGLLRVLMAIVAVDRMRRRCRPLHHPRVLELLDVVQAELGCTRTIEAMVCDDLATPATVGWRRPAVLLPSNWTDWSEQECQIVIAHEIAHVHRRDYLACIWAQVCLAVCWYNPIAHWLHNRLRLQQELAADAWAAHVSGGTKPYLTSLARMALRCDQQRLAGPARAFLPSRDTFLRRIQMLRDVPDVCPGPVSWTGRWMPLLSLAAATIVVAGIRGPASRTAEAANPIRWTSPAQDAVDVMPLIPTSAAMIVDIRPAELLKSPEAAKFVADLGVAKRVQEVVGLPLTEIDRAVFVWNEGDSPRSPRVIESPSAVILVAAQANQFESLAAQVRDAVAVPMAGLTYYRSGNLPDGLAYYRHGDRTIVAGAEKSIQSVVFAAAQAKANAPTSSHAFDGALKEVPEGPVRVAMTAPWLRAMLFPVVEQASPAGRDQWLLIAGPLMNGPIAHAFSIDVEPTLTLNLVMQTLGEQEAEPVRKTLEALITLGQNTLAGLTSQPPPFPNGFISILGVPRVLLDKAEVRRDGNLVRLVSSTDITVAKLTKEFAPAVVAARTAAERTQAMNNLKQIGLAMHNYADTYGSFPPAVLYGPDGKTPYSWRVALLPFLAAQPLYDQYRFDQPWDSPANQEVLKKMPALFRAPGDPSSGDSSSYYVVTGPQTIFSGKEGVGFRDILDGTSNTILVVETSQDTPWTKPEDLVMPEGGGVPKLGGIYKDGFHVTLADGSVKFLKDSINQRVLHALFTKAGGEVISHDAY